MQDVYAETVSAINFHNGIVRMLLVDQDPAHLMKKDVRPEDVQPRMKQQILMPLPGFLYMVSVIKSLLEDEKMQDVLARYTELGLISPEKRPSAAGDDQNEDSAAA